MPFRSLIIFRWPPRPCVTLHSSMSAELPSLDCMQHFYVKGARLILGSGPKTRSRYILASKRAVTSRTSLANLDLGTVCSSSDATVTNDGATILKSVWIDNPAARRRGFNLRFGGSLRFGDQNFVAIKHQQVCSSIAEDQRPAA